MVAVRALAVSALSLLAACATTPGHQLQAERDPLEKTNRGIYKFNTALDRGAVKPATKVYRAVVPQAAQRGLRNVFNNVDEPFSFMNALLQGKVEQAFRTAARFVINTTLGVGGLADHATDMGLPEEPEDFGQTLAVWGVGSGPYVMLPFFGPSTLRDAVGFGLERVGDPYRIGVGELNLSTLESVGLTGVELADTRSYVMDTAESLLQGSADEYATLRTAYLQFRWNVIHDGAPPEEEEPAPAAPGNEATPAAEQAPAATPVAPQESAQPQQDQSATESGAEPQVEPSQPLTTPQP